MEEIIIRIRCTHKKCNRYNNKESEHSCSVYTDAKVSIKLFAVSCIAFYSFGIERYHHILFL